MISLLISLLVLIVIIYVVNLVIGMLNLPDNVKQIFYIIFGLIVLLSLLNQFGYVGGAYPLLR